LSNSKKIYFASDLHLGAPNTQSSLKREKHFIKWLNQIEPGLGELYLVGDIFDFWFEYKHAVPKGFVRLLGKLAEIADKGIPIHFFIGNHDMWAFDYLPKEIGVKMYREPIEREINGKQFFIGHGDGLGPGDRKYKMLKKVFANPACQWLFGWIHPNLGIGLANYWSKKSRISTGGYDKQFLGQENEWLAQYCERKLQHKHYDYFIFGHRHLPLDLKVGQNSKYINLGDWIQDFTFAVFDGEKLELQQFDKP
jgi:UDP-2,3-diacylglucosamine hydrolase